MAGVKVNYYNVGDTVPQTITVLPETDVYDFCTKILGIRDLNNVKIFLNGDLVTEDDHELEDGDTVKIENKKSDSGA